MSDVFASDLALGFQAVDHELVVDDFVAGIDQRTVLLDRQFDDLDHAFDTRAKTARRGDHQLEDGFGGIAHVRPASTRLLARAKAASYEASHRVGPKRTAALRLLRRSA